MSETECKAKLAAKIANAIKDVGKIEKDGYNTFSNFRYVSNQRLSESLAPKWLEWGFIVMPQILNSEEVHGVSERNKPLIRTKLWWDFEILDTDTGFSMQKAWFSAEQDTGGKSGGKAATEGVKRFLFKLLQVVESEADPDNTTTPTGHPPAPTHWADNIETRDKFYKYCDENNITEDDYLKVLKCKDDIRETKLTKDEAIKAITGLIEVRIEGREKKNE